VIWIVLAGLAGTARENSSPCGSTTRYRTRVQQYGCTRVQPLAGTVPGTVAVPGPGAGPGTGTVPGTKYEHAHTVQYPVATQFQFIID
jgi:hypothetical protein